MSPLLKSVLTLLVLIFSLSFLTSSRSRAQKSEPSIYKEKERAIMRGTDFNPPVSIKAVKPKGRRVPVGGKFIDDDDWLRGFAVLVRNESNKTISHIGIEMLFRPVGKPEKLPAGWFLEYGPNPFLYKNKEAMPLSGVSYVTPNGERELKLTDGQYGDLKRFLVDAGFPEKVHVVEIRVSTIGFVDGTAWDGKMLRRDSKGGWLIDKPERASNPPRPPKSSAQSRAAFFLAPTKFFSEPESVFSTNPKMATPPCASYIHQGIHCDTAPNLPQNCLFLRAEVVTGADTGEVSEFYWTQCRTLVGGNLTSSCTFHEE